MKPATSVAPPEAGDERHRQPPLRIGLYVEAEEGVTWQDWRRLARLAEQRGFDTLTCAAHLQSLQAERRWSLDLWPVMAALALWTRRLAFGPVVLPVTFYHPSQVARLAASVDQLSQGRFRLSLGAGRHAGEHRAFGLAYPDYDQRIAMLGEAVQVVRMLWSGQPASFRGQWYHLEQAELRPTPVRPWLGVGSNSARGLRIAAAWADEWCTAGLSAEKLRQKNDQLDRLARQVGRDPEAISRTIMNGVLIGRDRAELERRAARLVHLSPSLGGLAPAAIVERAAREWRWWTGRPEEIVRQVRALVEAGADQVLFQVFDFRDSRAIRLLAETVLPALRSTASR